MSGSGNEPSPAPDEVASQMREATDKLRGKRWMIAPATPPAVDPQPEDADAEDG